MTKTYSAFGVVRIKVEMVEGFHPPKLPDWYAQSGLVTKPITYVFFLRVMVGRWYKQFCWQLVIHP
jgi:hypothetical protein